MKTYPQYDVVTRFNGDRCTVQLKAATKCGPVIEAQSTVTRSGREDNVALAKETLRIAKRNLASEYDVVAESCKSNDPAKHRGHR